MLYVPAEDLWHPDIVLYNTYEACTQHMHSMTCTFLCRGDGRYEMTEGTKATVYYNGLIKWTPPASFKSSCDIDALHFPFDQQTCGLQFGSWTYNIEEVSILSRRSGVV
jgi:nicotinic acetylcholine receptor